MSMSQTQRLAKRALDLTVAGTALFVASPVIAVSSLAVRYQMGSPVFFRQQRPGLNGKPFEMVKLRTMLTPEQAGNMSDGARLTPLGSWLRTTSIDELPTLWNVLKGDMSLVGPRPLLMQYLPLYSAEQSRRHDVKPGLTGLAQVRGRNDLSWEEKFVADVEYVRAQSLTLDLRILAETIGVVVRMSGINHGSSPTMPPFGGNACGDSERHSKHSETNLDTGRASRNVAPRQNHGQRLP